MAVDLPDFWREAYRLRLGSGSTAVAAPAFMAPLANGILATGKARFLLRHQQAVPAAAVAATTAAAGIAAAAAAAAGGLVARIPAAGSPASGSAAANAASLTQQCQRRLRAALQAQLPACAASSGSEASSSSVSSGTAGGAGSRPAVRMAHAAAALCLPPALSGAAAHSALAAAPAAKSGAAADRQSAHLPGSWPAAGPASSWAAPLLQQVTACLPPLLPLPPPPQRTQLQSGTSSGDSDGVGAQGSDAAPPSLQHASAEQLLEDCVLEPVRRQV